MAVHPVARIFRIAATILLLHGVSHQGARAQETPAATVSGVVKNRLTGQPIARALVDGGTDAMLTDSEGRFELQLPTGSRQLQVRRPGYINREQNSGGHRLNVEGDMSGLVLYLTPTASLTGHVSTPDGTDPSGMGFMAYRRRMLNGHQQWQQCGFANSDGDGVFTFYDLDSPGDYVLCSQLYRDRSMLPRQGKAGRGFPAQCYPVDLGSGPENLLHLAPGQQDEVEITRTAQPFYPVKIATPNHVPGNPGSFQVYAQNGLSIGAPFQWNPEGHTLDVDLPNGSYYVEARTFGQPPLTFGRVDFKVENASPASVSLVESPLAPVLVQVRKDFPAQADQQNSPVFIGNPDAPPVYLSLAPVDGMNGGGGARPIQRGEGASGDTWELEGITPGRDWVQVTLTTQGYVSAITSGGVDLTTNPLTIGPGNSVAPVEITLRNDTGQMDCTINRPAVRTMPGARVISSPFIGTGPMVYAIPARGRISRLANSNSATAGPVSLPNLAPGTYHVIALESWLDLESLDDQELARLEEKGKTVTVPAGGTVAVQLDVINRDDEEPTP